MPPPRGPPPQQPGQQQPQSLHFGPNDSLSLQQLRRYVSDANRLDALVYDFDYADMGSHAEEIDEWFVYSMPQWLRLHAAHKAFEWHWNNETGRSMVAWEDADADVRARFVEAAIAGVQSNDAALRSASIGKIVYLVLGRWAETALSSAPSGPGTPVASQPQLQEIKAGVELLAALGGLPVVWEALRACFEASWSDDMQQQQPVSQEVQDELLNLMTIVYISIQQTLHDAEAMASVHTQLVELNPSLVDFMLTATAKLRWDEQNVMPHAQMFLLFWKSILLVFGGSKEIDNLKKALDEMGAASMDQETITATPLDYHVFRQEITSKYPAYVPPRPPLPFDTENNSLLPPLPNQSSRSNAVSSILPTPAHAQSGGASILHQPVHIATPAPSPPPSPGLGGKGVKKQNYQTNQNLPFFYPPLDETSNTAGGKGPSAVHGALVSRKWEGSDIPVSILEAGELYSSRVRMTRATRQLWEERESFLKYERGWVQDDELMAAVHGDKDDDDDDDNDSYYSIEELDLDLSDMTAEEIELVREFKHETKKKKTRRPPEVEVDLGPIPGRVSDRDKQRLVAIELFFRNALPHLQSLVIALLRPILANVTVIVTQQTMQMASGMATRGNNPGNNAASSAQWPPEGQDETELPIDELDAARTREITAKAMTGILIMLLKWLKCSHILKFEYFTQLLLDSNYIPLVLKLFAHQDIQQVVDSKTDRVENSFFQFCNSNSNIKGRMDPDIDAEAEEEEQEEEEQQQQQQQEQEQEQEQGQEQEQEEEQEQEQEQEPKETNQAPVESGTDDGAEQHDDDSAVPPPIKRRRSPPPEVDRSCAVEEGGAEDYQEQVAMGRPEVDELGYPVQGLPTKPICDFARRNLFSLINYLRVMHKICKNKAHRNLMLVQYKSSQILRKSLRIPQQTLRLYTLKIFKNQVPYCGRKWRQSNMRVITAIYLHCRPELRDEWLAGSDIDAEVEGALPHEHALRSLTHWHNMRRFADKMAPDIRNALRAEQNFFTRELEKMGISWMDVGGGDDVMSEAGLGEAGMTGV
ncbi:hypothetical protein CDD82_199 [Ophiocordyceps australis]|uniref:Far11/STRP C-terminal domain-containing protein n=1 Tax=Ophiocordyceps australis TaxID=1399860 RepID=A0A2C5YN18_9HYPO|nr:hypothetical protein CDD82_199 [Ophiocordyceps australis]